MISMRATPGAAGVMGAVILLAGCAGLDQANGVSDASNSSALLADVDPIQLTVSSIFPETQVSGQLLRDWMEQVTEMSEGKVTFDFYGDATLHPATEALSALKSGLTQVTFVSTGYWPDQLPVAHWDDLVIQAATADLGFPNVNVAGPPAALAHYLEDSPVSEEFAKHNFVPLLPLFSGPSVLTCSSPFDSADDLSGRTVRVGNQVAQGENESLGMTGVFLPPNDQYEALQRGVIDCAVNAPTTVLAQDLLAVAPYATFEGSAVPSSGSMFAIAKNVWDDLPREVQTMMGEARNVALVNLMKNQLNVYADFVDAIEATGGALADPTTIDNEIRGWHASQPDLATAPPDGIHEADARAHIAMVRDIVDDWKSIITAELSVRPSSGGDVDTLIESWRAGADILDEDAYLAKINEYTSRY
ncbi:TRAP transporter substrate-binding protein DctP [Salinibacterium sp. ZJ454]|uniref:TRAP transporter substrate-binding protein DctP n=1 Tax=Salinibacterium sp. ZJ454 TaxID=2708339 RepID=UPI001421F4AB|nr:TRAP transporter substrate-binding protein DctP [Salinibacterium sp. ZJ454]